MEDLLSKCHTLQQMQEILRRSLMEMEMIHRQAELEQVGLLHTFLWQLHCTSKCVSPITVTGRFRASCCTLFGVGRRTPETAARGREEFITASTFWQQTRR